MHVYSKIIDSENIRIITKQLRKGKKLKIKQCR